MPPFSNHSHTSHTPKICQKAAQLLLCKLVRASVGNSNLWAHNLLNLDYLLLDAASSTQQTSTHTPSHILSLYLSLPYYYYNSTLHGTHHNSISSTASSRPQWTPLSLLSTTTSPHSTLHTPHSTLHSQLVTSLGWLLRPIALVDSAKVGYSTLQSKAQTTGTSTPQTLQGGLEECLNCCLLKLAFSGWRQLPTTGQILLGGADFGGEWIDRECSV